MSSSSFSSSSSNRQQQRQQQRQRQQARFFFSAAVHGGWSRASRVSACVCPSSDCRTLRRGATPSAFAGATAHGARRPSSARPPPPPSRRRFAAAVRLASSRSRSSVAADPLTANRPGPSRSHRRDPWTWTCDWPARPPQTAAQPHLPLEPDRHPGNPSPPTFSQGETGPRPDPGAHHLRPGPRPPDGLRCDRGADHLSGGPGPGPPSVPPCTSPSRRGTAPRPGPASAPNEKPAPKAVLGVIFDDGRSRRSVAVTAMIR